MLPFGRMLEYGNVKPVPAEPRITSSDYSSNFSLVQDGILYLTGSNSYNQLGVSSPPEVNNTWIKVPSTEEVLLCSTGYAQTIYVTVSGRVWLAGNDITVNPVSNTSVWKDVTSKFSSFDMSKIKDISIDRYGLMVIAEDGSVWGTGTDSTGWSGQGIQNVGFFTFKQIYSSGTAIRVFCGTGTGRILLENGVILSAGTNTYHQCNASSVQQVLTFTESFPGIDPSLIYQYKVCNNNCMIFLNDKRYYGTGWGSNGALGDGDTTSMNNKFYSGTLSVAPKNQRAFIKNISAASGSGTLYLGEDGFLYGTGYWGTNLISSNTNYGVFTKCVQSTVPYNGYLITGSNNSLIYNNGQFAVSSPKASAPTVQALVPVLGMGEFAALPLPK